MAERVLSRQILNASHVILVGTCLSFLVAASIVLLSESKATVTTREISDRMAITCPGAQGVEAVRQCSTLALDYLTGRDDQTLAVDREIGANAFALMNVIVSVGGLAISALALWLLARTLEETSKASNAAVVAANAAVAANAGFVEASKRQLRAYVVAERADLSNVGDGLVPHVSVTFRNTGQTPAENAVVITAVYRRILPDPAPDAPPFSALADPSVQTLGADCTFAVESHFPQPAMRPADWAAVARGEMELGIVLRCRYTDVFGREHEFTHRAHSYWHAGKLQFVAGTGV